MKSIPRTPESDELLKELLILPFNFSSIKKLLKEKNYSSDIVSRAGYDYTEYCWSECISYYENHYDEFRYSEAKIIPDIHSAKMPEIYELLLNHGLNPNAVCEGESIMRCASTVYNGYVAADTLALLIEHGGDPYENADGEGLFESIDFDVMFDAANLENRAIYDSIVHCWFVLLAFLDNRCDGKELVTIFCERRSKCNLDDFKISDLKNHRNYTFAITNVPGRGDNWSLHIIDKRTHWEVARL